MVVAVGLEPSTDLAQSAGLKLDPLTGGIHTDAGMKVCDGIWAVSKIVCFQIWAEISAGLQIYDGAGSLSHDFKVWPITFQGSGLSGPILFSCEKISL